MLRAHLKGQKESQGVPSDGSPGLKMGQILVKGLVTACKVAKQHLYDYLQPQDPNVMLPLTFQGRVTTYITLCMQISQ